MSRIKELPFKKIKEAVLEQYPTASTFATPKRDLFFLKHQNKIILQGKIPASNSVRHAWETVYTYLYNQNRIKALPEETVELDA